MGSEEEVKKSTPRAVGCWFNCDVSGIGLVTATWCLLAFACGVTNYFLLFYWWKGKNSWVPSLPLTDWGLVLFVIYAGLLSLTYFSHVMAVFSHPGVVTDFPVQDKKAEGVRWCKRCKIYKPQRAHHCKTCDRCIFRMDHHCPWVNNCVGFRNQRLFVLFLVYVATLSIFTLGIVLCAVYFWFYAPRDIPYSTAAIVCGVLLVIESAFFVFFVGDFLSEQIESIETNSTLVETYQHKRGRNLGLRAQVYEVMGPNLLMWWIPIPNPRSPDLNEPVYTDEKAVDHDEDYTQEELVEEVGILPDDPLSSSDEDSHGSREQQAAQTSGATIEDMIELRKLRERKQRAGGGEEQEN